jgi:Arc/MetJ-type ribon-helix-helix transcriptional regulator
MDTTERLVINLPKQIVDRLRERVAAGEFESESQLVESLIKANDALDDDLSPEDIEELRASIAEAEADIAAGRVRDADEVFDELEARYQAMIQDGRR